MLTIRVEQRHIDAGEECHATRCPVALAITETIGWPVGVDHAEIMTVDAGPELTWPTPDKVLEWVERFDLGLPVGPFEFVLDD